MSENCAKWKSHRLGQVGASWGELGPKKLQNFDIKKTSREEEERKKKNIGYRVALNERRLKILVGGSCIFYLRGAHYWSEYGM